MEKGGKLSNIAPTIIELLGETPPVEMSEPSLIIKLQKGINYEIQ